GSGSAGGDSALPPRFVGIGPPPASEVQHTASRTAERPRPPLLAGFSPRPCRIVSPCGRLPKKSRRKPMNFERLTTKSQQAVQAARDAALRAGHPEILPEHLLVAILTQEQGIGAPLVELAGAHADRVVTALQ